jgi:hypothetical protein
MKVVLEGKLDSHREIFRGKKSESKLIKKIKRLRVKKRKYFKGLFQQKTDHQTFNLNR